MKKIILIVIITLITFINVSYAIEKPTYGDYIRAKYGEDLTDAEVEQIIKREDLLKSIQELPRGMKEEKEKKEETEANKIEKFPYGNYPANYVGVKNFARKNFLCVLYSLRDISSDRGKQPIIIAGKNNRVYKRVGFDSTTWQVAGEGLSALEMVKWGINQFEPIKLFKQIGDNTIIKALYNGNISDYITYDSTNKYVAKLSYSNKELINMKPGDILLYVESNGKVSDYGIYVGKDKTGDYYGLAAHKQISNINLNSKNDNYGYFTNVLALSYINSTKVYPQEIDGAINLISGTKYNYIVRMNYMEKE